MPAENNDDVTLLTRKQLASRISVCPRSIDNFQRRRVIPYIRLGPRCIRFSLSAVLRALKKYEIRELGR
jgi:hypothetical protein